MKPADATPANAKKDAVLIIDDEKPLLDVFQAALSPFFEVTQATSSREAEFILHKKDFKVVIADHLMPGMSGSDLARAVVARHPQAAVVVVSGYSNVELDPGLVLLGKPFKLKELRDCVEAATARA